MLLQEFVGDCLADYPTEGMELHDSLSPASECNSTSAEIISNNQTPPKRHKPDHCAWSPTTRPDMPDTIFSFGSLNDNNNNNNNNNNVSNSNNENDNLKSTQHAPVPPGPGSGSGSGDGEECRRSTTTTRKPKRQADQCHNHIIAERQRRQNLSERFIALSALIPGLKKMDKTSVLGEAINHMKQLKERLKMLEEEKAKRAVESVVVVKRSQVIVDNEITTNSDYNGSDNSNSLSSTTSQDEQLPEIEARFADRSALLKIHCEIQKGVLPKLIAEIERLNLSITSTTAVPFNGRTLDITITAQMEPEFDRRPQDVVKDLRSIFQ